MATWRPSFDERPRRRNTPFGSAWAVRCGDGSVASLFGSAPPGPECRGCTFDWTTGRSIMDTGHIDALANDSMGASHAISAQSGSYISQTQQSAHRAFD